MPGGAPTVSVVIPAWNAAGSIGAALASVARQRYTDHEIVVVDDGSTDGTAEVARRLAPGARCLCQPNGGPARARNAGIAEARGELVAFLDADDEWLPDLLDTQVGYLRRHPEAALVHAAVRFEPEELRLRRRPEVTGEPGPPRARFCDLFHDRLAVHAMTVVVRRRVLAEVGGFDERREIHVEDWDLWMRIAARHPMGYVPRALAIHRRGGSMSTAFERTFRGQALVLSKAAPLCADACTIHREDPAACLRAARHRLQHQLGYHRLCTGDPEGARAALTAAIAEKPHALESRLLRAAAALDGAWIARLLAAKAGVTRLVHQIERAATIGAAALGLR